MTSYADVLKYGMPRTFSDRPSIICPLLFHFFCGVVSSAISDTEMSSQWRSRHSGRGYEKKLVDLSEVN